MSLKTKLRSFFAMDDDYDYVDEYEEEEIPFQKEKNNGKQNVVSIQSVQQSAKESTKVILIEPRSYSEAQDIADYLVNRKSVVINLQRVQHDQAKRIVDFLSGTVYAIGGDIQKLGTGTFLCTPENVDISGTISEISAASEEYTDNRW
jgi:cell division inhibitor SepF